MFSLVFAYGGGHNPSRPTAANTSYRRLAATHMTANAALDLSSLMQDVARQQFPAGALYVTATPVGNVGDISLRALQALALADAIACEDTRNTAQLLSRYGLNKELIAAHQHNEREVAKRLIERLQAGGRIALVSDAGTPAISDPGARIVESVHAAGLRVIPLPGASAALAVLSASGMTDDRFLFVGFLPAKAAQRDAELSALRVVPASLVLYEAPHRIADTIDALHAAFGPDRQIVIGRELTKLFEQVHSCRLDEAAAWLREDGNRLKGEFALVVEGAPVVQDKDDAETDRVLSILLTECSVKQAATLAAQITGRKKNALYERALALKNNA